MFWEIVERSMTTGGICQFYSGYLTEEDAQIDADDMASESEDSWFEVRQQRG